jgi:hypothetical protein
MIPYDLLVQIIAQAPAVAVLLYVAFQQQRLIQLLIEYCIEPHEE